MPRRHPARPWALFALLLVGATVARPVAAQPPDLFEFFEEEARALRVLTASRTPHALRDAPATVRVVTRDELQAYGAVHLWDALRGVPGVDVVSARSAHGLVSIRGLGKVNNNRTLVLLDGRRTLDGYVESLNWEALPVTLDEIDRIEVVEGPASALYGSNAISGVINIITRRPEEVEGARVSVAAGDRETRRVSALYGGSGAGALSWMASGEASTSNRFDDPERAASDVLRGRALARYGLGPDRELTLSGGLSDLRTELSASGLGTTYEKGTRGYAQGNLATGLHQVRASWMGGSTLLEAFAVGPGSQIDYGTFEGQAQTRLSPTPRTQLVVGGEVRRDAIEASIGDAAHRLWALFFEHRWMLHGVSLWTSGRIDRHPHAGIEFSPRLSVVAEPGSRQTVRLSLGSAFRHPTLLENHLDLEAAIDVMALDPTGQVDTIEIAVRGNLDLAPERQRFAELSHAVRLARLHTLASLYIYELHGVYATTAPLTTFPRDGVVRSAVSFRNRGTTTGVGGELTVEARLARDLSATSTYSYQSLSGRLDDQVTEGGTPHHKGSVRLRYARGGFTADAALLRVGATSWNTNRFMGLVPPYASVDPYTLLNLSLRYGLRRPAGLEAQFVAYDLLGDDHFEALPRLGPLVGGQSGEILRSRRVVRLAYRF